VGKARRFHGTLPVITFDWFVRRRTFYPMRRERWVSPVAPRQKNHLEELRHAVESAIAGLTPAQSSAHPPGKWSASEVLEHLYLTYTGTIKGFERLTQSGKSLATASTLTHRMRRVVVITFGHMPTGREAPPMARPRGLPTEKVLTEIVPKIAEMDALLSRCEQQFGPGPLLDHPILGPLTAAQWKKFHLVHGLHHVKQIRRLIVS
jgi:hypothetical protein